MAKTGQSEQPRTTEDFLKETGAIVGLNEGAGEEGMLTPEQIEAIERGEVVPGIEQTEEEKAAAAAAKVKEEQGEEGAAEVIDPKVLDAIQVKLASEEALTEEEQAILDKIDKGIELKEKEPEEVPQTYKIGSKMLSEEEAEKAAREFLKIGQVDLSKEARRRVIDTFVKAQNRSVAQTKIVQGYGEVAEGRRANTAERQRLEALSARLSEQRKNLIQQRQRLEGLAAKPVTEEDVAANNNDSKMLRDLIRKEDAVEQLPDIVRQEKELTDQEARTQFELQRSIINEFVAGHEEYKLPEDISVLARKITDPIQRESVPKEVRRKVRELVQLLEQAGTDSSTMEDIWDFRRENNTLAIRPTAQAAGPGERPVLPKPEDSLLKIKKYREGLSRGTVSRSGSRGAGGGVGPLNPSNLTARNIIETDRKIQGDNRADPNLKALGY
jgi:hypothetical protein